MLNILAMDAKELLALDPRDIARQLTADEMFHIAKVLGSFWSYDYEAAKEGKVGLHAELKSQRHSDGFFVSKIMLEPPNILALMGDQIIMRLNAVGICKPDYVVGIPDGATKLGAYLAKKIGAKLADMQKVDGKITLVTLIEPKSLVLLVEDFCTRGTGFMEAVKNIIEQQSLVRILAYDPVIINRGGVEGFSIPGAGNYFKVLPVAEQRVSDWDPAECPLCKRGSKPIKPKATDENWRLITTSQL
jgi:orotate phosphoribosyltransferase